MTDKICAKTNKFCPDCDQTKPLESFNKNKARHDGFEGYCKNCSYNRKQTRRKNNPAAAKKHNEYSKVWKEKNKQKYLNIHKKYREKNKEKIAQNRKSAERKKYNREYMLRRRQDPIQHIRHNISRQILHGLKRSLDSKRSQKIFDKLEYTPDQLKQHLENQFDSNMNWDNYGSYWHIDHIVPHSYFIYDSLDSQDFKKCWRLENLRPLEAKENIKKSNKIEVL